jgi:antitoxin (DNA-binding transcriptional repressor) of toxin-antitoxin stability system
MTQVNMLEAKSSLSKLVKDLEQHEEDVVYIARDGNPVVMMVRIPNQETASRFGIAEGQFTVPGEFDSWDEEISEMFEETI